MLELGVTIPSGGADSSPFDGEGDGAAQMRRFATEIRPRLLHG